MGLVWPEFAHLSGRGLREGLLMPAETSSTRMRLAFVREIDLNNEGYERPNVTSCATCEVVSAIPLGIQLFWDAALSFWLTVCRHRTEQSLWTCV